MQPVQTARLAPWQVRLLSSAGLLLWLTGTAWVVVHYFGGAQGPFGPQANPAEPWMLRLHGAAMLAVLVGVGGLLVAHVWQGWRHRRQRWIGLALLVVAGILILSGYLLYYPFSDESRPTVSLIHWTVGLASLPLFVWHYLTGRRRRARAN